MEVVISFYHICHLVRFVRNTSIANVNNLSSGVTTDMIVYSIIIPVVPFQLEHLGYTGISALSGWLIFAFVSNFLCSSIPLLIMFARVQSGGLVVGESHFCRFTELMEVQSDNTSCSMVRVLQGSQIPLDRRSTIFDRLPNYVHGSSIICSHVYCSSDPGS